MSDPPVELSYSQAALPWYKQRRWQRWCIALVLLAVVGWFARLLPPMWDRYQYYQIQQRAVHWQNSPQPMAVHFSATQPYAHLIGPVDEFYAQFWAKRSKAGLPSLHLNAGGSIRPKAAASTPVFCGVLSTSIGQPRLVYIYATPDLLWPPRSVSLDVFSIDLREARWALTSRTSRSDNDTNYGTLSLTLEKTDDVTVSTGTINPADASEVDVTVTISGHSNTIKLHVIDMGTPLDQVGFATTMDAFTDAGRGWPMSGIYDQPQTSK